MPNITITDVDLGSPVLEKWGEVDAVLDNAAGTEETFLAGTILARSTADDHLEPFADAGLNGLDVPAFVLTYDVTLAAGASTAIMALSAGKVNATRLIIHDGTAITPAHLDALRGHSIVPVDVTQLGMTDNPQS